MALPTRSPPTINTLRIAYTEAQQAMDDLAANAAWISVQGTEWPRRRANLPLKKKILSRRRTVLDVDYLELAELTNDPDLERSTVDAIQTLDTKFTALQEKGSEASNQGYNKSLQPRQ